MKKTLLIIGASLCGLIGILFYFMWHVTDGCDDMRCQLTSIMPRVGSIQREVESSMRVIVSDRKIPKSGEIDYGYIGKDGSIIIVNETSKMMIVARPERIANVISWRCYAYPEKANALDLLLDCGKKFRSP